MSEPQPQNWKPLQAPPPAGSPAAFRASGRRSPFRFAVRLTLFAMTLVILSVGVSSVIAYQLKKRSLETALSNELLAIVHSLAPLIDAELHEHIRCGADGAPESEEEFESIRQQLVKVKHRNQLTSHGSPIYTLRPAPDFDRTRELEFVVMTDRDKDGRYFIGNRYPAQPHLLEALAGRAACTPLYADAEGIWISAAAPIITDSGQVVGILQADRTANFFHRELRRQTAALALGALATIGLAAVLALVFARTLVRPLTQLAEATRRIARGEFRHRVPVRRPDEMGELAEGFNTMADTLEQREQKLERARRELLEGKETLEARVHERTRELFEQVAAKEKALVALAAAQQSLATASHQAGMAEVATGVLHNVGNVLNSVNVSAHLVLDGLRNSKTATLAKTVALLREHHDHLGEFLTVDPRGRRVPQFLERLVAHLSGEQAGFIQELCALQQNVDHIKQIVAMQQSYAKVSGAVEHLLLHELAEDALRICSTALASHKIQVERQFTPTPPVLVDRHKALQILVNLVRNAIQALDVRPEGRRLTVRVAPGPEGRVRVEVIDNGLGIAPENLTKIFQHGFTTKKDGHGFGLHSGALAAREMGGNLAVHSEGVGRGATFTLELPLPNTAAAPQAA
jgi:signal transduction histidine kinase